MNDSLIRSWFVPYSLLTTFFCVPYCKVWPAMYLAPFMQNLPQWVGRQSASLPLISPSHPLLMFSTESEPCRMCTETSAGATRSTLLLPGRGSDYIWSINTPWLWEALCLSLFLLSSLPHGVFASLCLTPARLLQYDIWSQSVKQSVFDAIFSYIISGFAWITLSTSLSIRSVIYLGDEQL